MFQTRQTKSAAMPSAPVIIDWSFLKIQIFIFPGNQDRYKPWEYTYDPANDTYTCPRGGILRHTTTDRDGKRTYRSTPKECVNCPCKAKCGANEKGQKLYTAHIWQEYLDLVEQIRKTQRAKDIYKKNESVWFSHSHLAALLNILSSPATRLHPGQLRPQSVH